LRSLITGVGGFSGQHLAVHLLERGDEVFGVARRAVQWHRAELASAESLTVLPGDLTVAEDAQRIVEESKPERIYLLAAVSSVPESFADPTGAINNNIACVLNMLEAARTAAPNARVLIVGSSDVYGGGEHLDETAELRPENPYGVSKVAVDMLGYQYHVAHRMHTVRVRPFTHLGPGQSVRFATASFAQQIAEIEKGLREPVIRVGNLAARRDFTDVRDVARAYDFALERGERGAAYNVGRGEAVAVQSLLDQLVEKSPVRITVEIDQERFRPVDAPVQFCDNTRLRGLGWSPEVPLTQTLDDILRYWREQVTAETSSTEA
jgi:GDP-4-dehydro-6-deoxy-D-mannose reductase